MTKAEFKKSNEYKELKERIKSYKEGFEFSIYPLDIPKAKYNALNILLQDCIKEGYISPISFELSLELKTTKETYKRTSKK